MLFELSLSYIENCVMKSVVKVAIEKSNDGLFSAYCPNFQFSNKYSLGGFGDSAQEAQEDFITCVAEVKEICQQQGENCDELDDLEFVFEHTY